MKKATISIVAKIFLLVLTGFVVIFLMMSFFPPLREAVMKNIKIPYIPNVEPVSGGFAFMKEPLNSLKSVMEKARDSPTQSGCIVLPEALPGDFQDYRVFVQRHSGGTDIFVEKGGIKSDFLTVDRMYPCAVYGNDASSGQLTAKNFYDNWLSGTRCPGCKKDFNEFTEIIIPEAGKITIDGTKLDRQNVLYLYKADAGHVCFFTTYGSLLGSCGAKQEGLNRNCANAIKASLPECAAPASSTTTTMRPANADRQPLQQKETASCRPIPGLRIQPPTPAQPPTNLHAAAHPTDSIVPSR